MTVPLHERLHLEKVWWDDAFWLEKVNVQPKLPPAPTDSDRAWNKARVAHRRRSLQLPSSREQPTGSCGVIYIQLQSDRAIRILPLRTTYDGLAQVSGKNSPRVLSDHWIISSTLGRSRSMLGELIKCSWDGARHF